MVKVGSFRPLRSHRSILALVSDRRIRVGIDAQGLVVSIANAVLQRFGDWAAQRVDGVVSSLDVRGFMRDNRFPDSWSLLPDKKDRKGNGPSDDDLAAGCGLSRSGFDKDGLAALRGFLSSVLVTLLRGAAGLREGGVVTREALMEAIASDARYDFLELVERPRSSKPSNPPDQADASALKRLPVQMKRPAPSRPSQPNNPPRRTAPVRVKPDPDVIDLTGDDDDIQFLGYGPFVKPDPDGPVIVLDQRRSRLIQRMRNRLFN